MKNQLNLKLKLGFILIFTVCVHAFSSTLTPPSAYARPSFTVTINLRDWRNDPIEGREVYVDGIFAGVTLSDGSLVISDVELGRHVFSVPEGLYRPGRISKIVRRDRTVFMENNLINYGLRLTSMTSSGKKTLGVRFQFDQWYNVRVGAALEDQSLQGKTLIKAAPFHRAHGVVLSFSHWEDGFGNVVGTNLFHQVIYQLGLRRVAVYG